MASEIDARVAEAFGWRIVQHKGATTVKPLRIWTAPDGEEMGYEDTFRPSTDISTAWLVVEKMRERGYWLTLEQLVNDEDSWGADFGNEYGESFPGIGLTAPLAICRAALQALEHA